MEEAITDYLVASQIPQMLLQIFKDFHPDTSKQNLADMFFGGQKIVYKSNIFYKTKRRDVEIEQIEYQEVNEEEKLSHNVIAKRLLEENEIRVYENTLYIYDNGVYRKNEKSIHQNILQ